MTSLDVFNDVKMADINLSNNNNRQVRRCHVASSVVSDDVMSLVSTDDNSVAMDVDKLDTSLDTVSDDVSSVCECDDVIKQVSIDSRSPDGIDLSTSKTEQTLSMVTSSLSDCRDPHVSILPETNNNNHNSQQQKQQLQQQLDLIGDTSDSDIKELLALERKSSDVTTSDDDVTNSRALVTQRRWGDVEQERQLEERLLQLGLLRNKLFLEHCLRQQLQRNIDTDDLFAAVNRCKRHRDVRSRVDSCRREIVSAVQPRITRDAHGNNVTYSVCILMGVFTHCVKHKVNDQTVTIQGQAPKYRHSNLFKEVNISFPASVDMTSLRVTFNAGVCRCEADFYKTYNV